MNKNHYTKGQRIERLKKFSHENFKNLTTAEDKFLFLLYQVRKYLRFKDIDLGSITPQNVVTSNTAKTGYIIDYVIPRLRLAFEIDGSSHDNKKEYDDKRQKYIETKGYSFIRYNNDDVFKPDMRDKLREDILEFIKKKYPNGSVDLHYSPVEYGVIRELRYRAYTKERHLRR
jgi:hypothetical protein